LSNIIAEQLPPLTIREQDIDLTQVEDVSKLQDESASDDLSDHDSNTDATNIKEAKQQVKMMDVIKKSGFQWKIMSPNEIDIASTFVLTHLWKVVKFFHLNLLIDSVNLVMKKELKIEMNHERYNDYFHDCKKIVTDGIGQRRSYATKQIQRVLKRKLIENIDLNEICMVVFTYIIFIELVTQNEMFDIELLDKFYKFSNDSLDLKEVEEEVKEAYIMFIGVLVPVISLNWKQYLKTFVKNRSNPSYASNNNLTVSDEAYTLWLIKRYLPGIVDEIKFNKPVAKKGRKGPHLSKTYKTEYMELFRIIDSFRNEDGPNNGEAFKYFEQMFFDTYFDSKGIKKPSKSTAYVTNAEKYVYLEKLVLDEDRFHLLSSQNNNKDQSGIPETIIADNNIPECTKGLTNETLTTVDETNEDSDDHIILDIAAI
jgi:hypothetical protein